jgi:hypothetical protein
MPGTIAPFRISLVSMTNVGHGLGISFLREEGFNRGKKRLPHRERKKNHGIDATRI